MGVFDRQINFINEFESQLFKELEIAIRSFDFVLKDYIVNKQLFREGIDGKGEKLPGYKRTTIRLKIAKGDPADRTTLRDEGDFHSQIQIDAFNDRFEVSSNVNYDKFILKRYGKDVLRITDENFREFMKNYYLPKLKEYVNNKFAK
jgi:hypothetical protein